MKLKAKILDIETGGSPIVILNYKDSMRFDLHPEDRVKIRCDGKVMKAIIDIAHTKTVSPGQIGFFSEAAETLRIKKNQIVTLQLDDKPASLHYIRKKLDGGTLTKKEIRTIVDDIVANNLSNIELTYFVSACYSRTMTDEETILLTKAMVESGETLKLNKKTIFDKHCIGGVAGNRTTMVVVPIIAAAGLICPKTSSRSITSPAGTADTMEVLTNVKIDLKKMKTIIGKTNACLIWGGALNLAPADDKIIRVERPLSIDAESQLIASIMAKKLSVSSTHILIDIPIGKGAKVETMAEALKLKHGFEIIGEKLGRFIKVIITDGSQPVGNGIGPALEARDVLWLLMRDPRGPKDLEKKSVFMAARIFEMAGIPNGEEKARNILDSGVAFKKMKEICIAQGLKTLDPDKLLLGKFVAHITAPKPGRVKEINNNFISKVARVAGAPEYSGAGLYLYKHKNDRVKKGDVLFTIYSGNQQKLGYALELAKSMSPYKIG